MKRATVVFLAAIASAHLEHQDLEHQDGVIGWAATPRSIRASERRQQRSPENLELDQLSQPDQWVA